MMTAQPAMVTDATLSRIISLTVSAMPFAS
jgi:hypothetical protein